MFIEEHCELFVIDTLRAAMNPDSASYNASLENVKGIEVGEVTLETLGQYMKNTPGIVLNIGEDNRAMSSIGARGDAQHMIFDMFVYISVTNRFSVEAGMNEARSVLRGVRDALRGLLWTENDGADENRQATEGRARIFYVEQSKEAVKGATSLYLQKYEVHSQDFNDHRRSI